MGHARRVRDETADHRGLDSSKPTPRNPAHTRSSRAWSRVRRCLPVHPRETEVRRWAQARGIEAADRGRARFHVVEQYRRAHAGPGPATSP
ncbi:hypothetical protein EBM89_09095 [Cellulomonas triticagri]|uniref:Lsr2 DNA-binding domain-containing protein n=1 Tax=Cellulomonas triticagri TaxID=2483352 RepID=A0A3M2JDN2_9CELL|nr:hypothetical protein EBM89_09095 [Cellulomonas triticagri]